jgi:hypothetical protein
MPHYLYNVTVNVDQEIHDAWKSWMESTHIPDVLATGLFVGARLCLVMAEEDSGCTYAIQYQCPDLESYKLYQELHAPRLQAESQSRFGGKYVAFRTLLELHGEWTTPASKQTGIV